MAEVVRPYECNLVPLGDGVVLALARGDGLSSATTLSASHDDGRTFARVTAPARIVAVAGTARRWLALTKEALHESDDGGGSWRATPLPPPPPSGLFGHLEWIDGRAALFGEDSVVVRDDDAWRRAWQAPAFRLRTFLTGWRDLGDAGRFVIGSPTRIYRVPASGDRLEDFTSGWPEPATVGEGSPPLGRVGDWLVAGFYVRRIGAPAWQPLEEAGGDGRLEWMKRAFAVSEWHATPWAADAWLGFSWDTIYLGDDAHGARPLWRAPDPNRGVVMELRCGAGVAFASFRRATDELAGVRIDAAGASVVRLVDGDPRGHGA